MAANLCRPLDPQLTSPLPVESSSHLKHPGGVNVQPAAGARLFEPARPSAFRRHFIEDEATGIDSPPLGEAKKNDLHSSADTGIDRGGGAMRNCYSHATHDGRRSMPVG